MQQNSFQDPETSHAECVPTINHIGSGAKIKRSTAKQCNLPKPYGSYTAQMLGMKKVNTSSLLQSFDSLASISTISGQEKPSSRKKDAKEMEVEDDLHPVQSIFLGSDRRYNRYWLFWAPVMHMIQATREYILSLLSMDTGRWLILKREPSPLHLFSMFLDNFA